MGVDVSRLLAPRSVAVVGATDRPAAYGSEALLNLRRWGFDGAVYAVNPGRSSVHGRCVITTADETVSVSGRRTRETEQA